MYGWQNIKRRRKYVRQRITEKPADFMEKQCMWNKAESFTKIKILGVILTP
jgi:hypothetical protein